MYRGSAATPFYSSTALAAGASANHVFSHVYTTGADDESTAGGSTSYTCKASDGTNDGAASTPADTVKINAPTTTAAPTTTTTAGGSGGKSGAGSYSPVTAVFLLTIAAMCF